MTVKKKRSFINILLEYSTLIPSIVNLANNIVSFINLEARLTGKSIFNILLLSAVFALLLATSWLCLLAMILAYFVIYLHMHLIAAIAIILLINTLAMVIIGLMLAKAKNDLLFSRSCRSLTRSISDDIC